MNVAELFRMEVRAADDAVLLGWLPAPLVVRQGGRDWWAFERPALYGEDVVHTVRLPVARYAEPNGHTWWAFKVEARHVPLLPELAGFVSA